MLCQVSTSERDHPLSVAGTLSLLRVGVFDCRSTCQTFSWLQEAVSELCATVKHVVEFWGPCGILLGDLGFLAGSLQDVLGPEQVAQKESEGMHVLLPKQQSLI